jgi:hypothetical protein
MFSQESNKYHFKTSSYVTQGKEHIMIKSILKYRQNAFIAIVIVLGIFMLINPVQADDGPKVPALKVRGKTIGDWAAKWWQWAMSIPLGSNPLLGGECDQNQRGPVWYLAGNLGGTDERDCTVPRGKSIFFPLVNAMFFNDPPPTEPVSVEEKRAELDDLFSLGCNLSSTLDGTPTVFYNPIIRTQSPTFPIEFIEDNIFGVDPGWVDEEVVSDGFWIMLPPLTNGEHVIHFAGALCDAGVSFFEVDVTYTLLVE